MYCWQIFSTLKKKTKKLYNPKKYLNDKTFKLWNHKVANFFLLTTVSFYRIFERCSFVISLKKICLYKKNGNAFNSVWIEISLTVFNIHEALRNPTSGGKNVNSLHWVLKFCVSMCPRFSYLRLNSRSYSHINAFHFKRSIIFYKIRFHWGSYLNFFFEWLVKTMKIWIYNSWRFQSFKINFNNSLFTISLIFENCVTFKIFRKMARRLIIHFINL